MQKLGKKRLEAASAGQDRCASPIAAAYTFELSDGGGELTYNYDTKGEPPASPAAQRPPGRRHPFYDLDTTQSSLEDIFVSLVRAHEFQGCPRDLSVRDGRTWRTLLQSIVSPWFRLAVLRGVGAAIGSRSPGRGITTAPSSCRNWVMCRADARASPMPRSASTSRIRRHDLSNCCQRRSRITRSWLGYVGAAATKSIISA